MNATLIAGVLSGLAGLMTFLVIHQIWITPIWFILPIGLVIAALGGLAVGWAYELLSPGLPAGMWRVPAFAGLIVLILLPALVLPHLRSPIFAISSTGTEQLVPTAKAVRIFLVELVVTAPLAGALVGLWIGGSREAALRTALAGLVFALGPGHNIPLISGVWSGVLKSWVLLGAIILCSTIPLVAAEVLFRQTR